MSKRAKLYESADTTSDIQDNEAGWMLKKITGIERLAHQSLPKHFFAYLVKRDRAFYRAKEDEITT